MVGTMPFKFPVFLGMVGILSLHLCLLDNMRMHYDVRYTAVCFAFCFLVCMLYPGWALRKTVWATLIAQQTAVEIEKGKHGLLTAQGIHEFLAVKYFAVELQGDVA